LGLCCDNDVGDEGDQAAQSGALGPGHLRWWLGLRGWAFVQRSYPAGFVLAESVDDVVGEGVDVEAVHDGASGGERVPQRQELAPWDGRGVVDGHSAPPAVIG